MCFKFYKTTCCVYLNMFLCRPTGVSTHTYPTMLMLSAYFTTRCMNKTSEVLYECRCLLELLIINNFYRLLNETYVGALALLVGT